MSKTRAFISAAAVLLSLSAFSSAADRFIADLSGTWNVSVQTPDQSVTSTLIVQQKGDSLSGSLQSELGTAPLKGAVKGDTVNFVFTLDMGGQALSISASALLKDKDNMSGSMDVSGMGNMPFTAARAK